MHRYATIITPVLILLLFSCREEYLPPSVGGTNNFLVIEGIVNSGADSTILKLTRTRNLSDTTAEILETSASILLESKSGVNYSIPHLGNGRYGVASLALNPAETYRLRVSTPDGALYASDYVEVKTTPSIDSVTWEQNEDVFIKLYTHDPLNKTRFYRWDFSEIWEYNTFYDSDLGFDYTNNIIFFRDSSQLLTRCWSGNNSTDILLGSTSNLAIDRVDSFPIQRITRGSDKISTRYSILVKQYALTAEAYKYWQLLRKNSKELGSIFGTQPTELISNIRNLNNPAEPVIGYISISTVSQKRIFIRNNEVRNWNSGSSQNEQCEPIVVTPDSISYYLHTRQDYWPAYFITGGGLAIAKKICVDCTVRGGKTQKPSFW